MEARREWQLPSFDYSDLRCRLVIVSNTELLLVVSSIRGVRVVAATSETKTEDS
ncbi:hypothetical protein CRG98_011038 [Punica granatum]|uniref:Uncharacterized protein n=1 Tax=Punica granatum TaxID=22663 RepID=A0A2I0KJ54_PUNGR|nr:hypothetical protein CRG98_011038 [Punica granatum]